MHNKSYYTSGYNIGYSEGVANALDSGEIVYTYHSHTEACNPSTETCYHNWVKTGSKEVWKSDTSGTGHYCTVSVYTATGSICGGVSTGQDSLEDHSSWIENKGFKQSNWSHNVTVYGCGYEEGAVESATIIFN